MNVSALWRISLGTLPRALGEARHFALVEKNVAIADRGFAASLCGWNSVQPRHLFGHYVDHDYYLKLPAGAGRATSLTVIYGPP
jgi:hypothetical protein